MTFEDPTTWELCGVSYSATRMKANDIALIVFQTDEWINYAIARDLVANGDFSATSREGRALVDELVRAYRAAFRKTLQIVKQELGEDA